jgi:hypothetical protein
MGSYSQDPTTGKRPRTEESEKSSRQKTHYDNRLQAKSSSSAKSILIESSDGPPHFLIIGAQKAGTMAAVKNLNKHSSVFMLSEIHFFDLAWNYKTPQYYRDLFKKAGPGKKMIGEKTPEYIYVDECASRIKQVCPNAKFIFFIRDPVKRAFSSWNMQKSKGIETSQFDTCIDNNLMNLDEYRSFGTAESQYVQRGFYIDQIERFLKIFPNRDNFIVVVAEHIQKDPETHYNRIFDFLNVKREVIDYEDDHVGTYTAPMNATVKDKLTKVFQPYNERLFEFLGYRIPEWDHVSK